MTLITSKQVLTMYPEFFNDENVYTLICPFSGGGDIMYAALAFACSIVHIVVHLVVHLHLASNKDMV